MITHRVFQWTVAFGIVCLSSFSLAPHVNAEDRVTVQVVARGIEPTPAQLFRGAPYTASAFGHLFLILSIHSSRGTTEEAFGFYPRGTTLKGMIKGRGMLKSEYRCQESDDCGAPEVSIKRYATEANSATFEVAFSQIDVIMKDVLKWNSGNYDYTKNNCMDFVGSVLNDLGYLVPARSPTQTPTAYVASLKTLRLRQPSTVVQTKVPPPRSNPTPTFPVIAGPWLDKNHVSFSVTQAGKDLVFTGPPPFGTGKGTFKNTASFQMSWPKYGQFDGSVTQNAMRIDWSNGMVWTKK